MGDSRLVVGIDLGGTHMQVGVVRETPDAGGEIVHRFGTHTRAEEGFAAVVERMGESVREVCERAGVGYDTIEAIGVGAPGAMDPSLEIVLSAPNMRWTDVPLAARLRDALPGKRVIVDNDVNVATYGEFCAGAAKDAPSCLGVWVGTGVGGGLVLDGRLYRGDLGSAGEIGMTVLFPDLPRETFRMEHHTSRKFVTQKIVAAIEAGQKSSLGATVREGRRVTASDVARAYAEGDALTRREVDRGADLLGLAIANAVTLLALPLVVLGGGFVEALGEGYVGRVAESMRRHVHPASNGEKVGVRVTALRENAGLLGAAMLALRETRDGQ